MSRGFREPVEKLRRFYAQVAVAETVQGFGVQLDGRALRTPGGNVLVLPTRALAGLVAAEWTAQAETIELAQMHATRLANTATDTVPGARDATAGSVVGYAASDLVCYFAEEPSGLVARQHEHWGAAIDRIEAEAKVAFVRASGIVHQAQPQATLDEVRTIALALDDFALAGLAFGAALFGSAILAISLQRGWVDGDQALELSRLDELWQEERWGVDAEAAERVARLREESRMLDAWFRALTL